MRTNQTAEATPRGLRAKNPPQLSRFRIRRLGYEPEGDFWWAIAGDGRTRIRFLIDSI